VIAIVLVYSEALCCSAVLPSSVLSSLFTRR